jgi:hypothetical protein
MSDSENNVLECAGDLPEIEVQSLETDCGKLMAVLSSNFQLTQEITSLMKLFNLRMKA